MDNLEARKLDVTIQTNQNEEMEELSLADIFHALRRNVVKLVAWVLVGVLIGGIGGGAYVMLTQRQQVTTVIAFAYDGIEHGLDPAGGVLDVNKLKAPVVVEDALVNLGWTTSDDLNAETIRQAISIESIVPQDVIDRLTVITTIATNAGTVSNLEKVLDVDYYPTRFRVSIDSNALKLGSADACALLNAVLDSYGDYFNEMYTDTQFLGTALNIMDYADYDYTEVIDIVTLQLEMMTDYMKSLREKDTNNSFRSIATGYSSSDIISALDMIQSKDVAWLSALVYSYNLTSDKELLKTYLNHQLDEYQRQQDAAKYTFDAINSKIATYKKDTAMMVVSPDATGNSAVSQQLTIGSVEYDKMMEQSVTVATNIATIISHIDKIKDRIAKIVQVDVSLTTAEYDSRRAQAETRLGSISRKMDKWVDVITKTAKEFYATIVMKDAYKVLAPARDVSDGKLMSLVKYAGLGAAGAAGVVLLLYVIGTCFALVTGDDKSKRKGRQAQDQVASV